MRWGGRRATGAEECSNGQLRSSTFRGLPAQEQERRKKGLLSHHRSSVFTFADWAVKIMPETHRVALTSILRSNQAIVLVEVQLAQKVLPTAFIKL